MNRSRVTTLGVSLPAWRFAARTGTCKPPSSSWSRRWAAHPPAPVRRDEFLLPGDLTRPNALVYPELSRRGRGSPEDGMAAVHGRLSWNVERTKLQQKLLLRSPLAAGSARTSPSVRDRRAAARLACPLRGWLPTPGRPGCPARIPRLGRSSVRRALDGVGPDECLPGGRALPSRDVRSRLRGCPTGAGVFMGAPAAAMRVRLEVAAEVAATQ